MRRHLWVISAISVILAAGAGTWALTSPSLFTSAIAGGVSNAAGDAARGKLVFAAGDCAACHASPGQADRFQLGGGLALASPYGTFRAPNISMDPVDGIGRWTTKDLANALLRGVSPDGRHYYPVFRIRASPSCARKTCRISWPIYARSRP